jgi:predicted membrane protein
VRRVGGYITPLHDCFLTLKFLACNLTVQIFSQFWKNCGSCLGISLRNCDLLISCLVWRIILIFFLFLGFFYNCHTTPSYYCFLTFSYMTCNLTVKVHKILEKLGQHCGVLFVTMIFWSAAWFGEIFAVFLNISTIICLWCNFSTHVSSGVSQGMCYMGLVCNKNLLPKSNCT